MKKIIAFILIAINVLLIGTNTLAITANPISEENSAFSMSDFLEKVRLRKGKIQELIASKSFQPENKESAKITFAFDDGAKSIYKKALPILAKAGIPAVYFGETAPLESGENWVMTWDQVRSLQNDFGWEIGSHTANHPFLTQISEEQLEKELSESKRIFRINGIDARSFASPYGDYNNRVTAAIARHYQSHRTAWGNSGLNLWPEINNYQIHCIEISNTAKPSEIIKLVDQAIKEKKWLIFLMHDIVDGQAGPYQYAAKDLQKIINSIKNLPLKFTTIAEELKYPTGPDLAPNGSFENIDESGWARGWQQKGTALIDAGIKGSWPNPYKSLKIQGGIEQNEAASGLIPIKSEKEYGIKIYQNIQDHQAGGAAVWIGEYDSADNWIGGKWIGGTYGNFVGTKSYIYKPASPNAAQTTIHIYTEINSSLTLYADSIEFKEL